MIGNKAEGSFSTTEETFRLLRPQGEGAAMAHGRDAGSVARSWLDAFNRGDWKALEGALAPGATYEEFGSQRRFEGSSAIVQAYQGWKTAMPDLKAVLSTTYQEGDRVALELIWEGTHSGPLETSGGILPPSGKHLGVPWVMTIDVSNGKIKRTRSYFDMLSLKEQIGTDAAGCDKTTLIARRR